MFTVKPDETRSLALAPDPGALGQVTQVTQERWETHYFEFNLAKQHYVNKCVLVFIGSWVFYCFHFFCFLDDPKYFVFFT